MRILQVTNLFDPVHGGVATSVYQLSRHLVKRGHVVTVYTSDYKMSHDFIDAASGVDVRVFKSYLNLANFYVTPDLLFTRKFVAEFDIIHLHNYRSFQNVVIGSYARKQDTPYVLQAHGSLPHIISKRGLKTIFDNLWGYRLLSRAERLIAVTGMEMQQYVRFNIHLPGKIELVPIGVDLSEFSSLPIRGEFREKYGIGLRERIILFVGRIHKIKGLSFLINAFAGIAGQFEDTWLVIVGPDDGYTDELRQIILRLGVSRRVILTGALYGRAKLQAYMDSDVVVLPSVYEIFGTVILEAWACGKPVIVTAQCGMASTVNNQAGFVVVAENKQLEEAIIHLFNDNELRDSFGRKGKQLVSETFNWEKISAQMENVYTNVLCGQ